MPQPRLIPIVLLAAAARALAGDGWKSDPAWHDGLVEKATYAATRTVYGKPRAYTAVFFTNKEQHDVRTFTKADRAKETVEVFKHNQIEVIPTPNYDYKFTTTAHLRVGDLRLTRLDMGSQEFCGTTFKQYVLRRARRGGGEAYDYFAFSYLPEEGRRAEPVGTGGRTPVVAFNALPLWLRDYDFAARPTVALQLLPDQKSNRLTPAQVVAAEVRHAGEDGGDHKIELAISGRPAGTFWMANDRLHVMTRYESADGTQAYRLEKQERVDYWTRRE